MRNFILGVSKKLRIFCLKLCYFKYFFLYTVVWSRLKSRWAVSLFLWFKANQGYYITTQKM